MHEDQLLSIWENYCKHKDIIEKLIVNVKAKNHYQNGDFSIFCDQKKFQPTVEVEY